MFQRVSTFVEKWQMIQKEDKIVLGVSGGADSICLLFVLLELQKIYGFDMIAVHVHHGLRGDAADRDVAFVKKVCEENDIQCEVFYEDVELIAKKRKQSIEEAGREVRRKIFEKVLDSFEGTKIALAHHKNDNVETLFMNLARGTGIQGLGGIHPIKGNTIRPLLCVERKEIEDYLEEKGISYCTDDTNNSDEYTRNRIRKHIISYMEEEINTKTVKHIDETMSYLREVQDFLAQESQKGKENHVQETDRGVLLQEGFVSLPKVLKSLIIKDAMATVAGKEKDLEATHVLAVSELFDKQVGRNIDLPYGMKAKRVYSGVEILRENICEQEIAEIFLEPSDIEKEILFGETVIRYRIYTREEWDNIKHEKSNTKGFDYDIINDKVCVRTRRMGDYISLEKERGTQKLKSYFINEKIEQSVRNRVPLIADGNHILWIVGYRENPRYAVSENTKIVLNIQIDEGE